MIQVSIQLEKLLLDINDTRSKEIKKFKQRVYFLMNNLNEYISFTDNELKNNHNELIKIKKDIQKTKTIDKDKTSIKQVKAPKESILKEMSVATEGLLKFNSNGLQLGSLSLSYLLSLKSFKITDKNKLSKIQHITINLGKKYLSKLPLESIGLKLKTNKNDIYKNGFRIFHKKPNWENELNYKSIRDIGYVKETIFKRTIDLISLYSKNKKAIKTLADNTNKIQSLVYETCDVALNGLNKDEEIYMRLFYVTKNLFFINEIMSLKCYMWLNKTMKYHILASKAFL
jgi:hypothetical protein